MKKHLYFAYGSNLNAEQMKFRCPDAVELSPAVLPSWRLTARRYANVEAAAESCVNGALYLLSDSDLAALDRYEGCPDLYTRRLESVTDCAGVYHLAWVYTMTEAGKQRRAGEDYPENYRAICAAGAEYWGIPNAFAGNGRTAPRTLFPDEIPGVAAGIARMLAHCASGQPLPRAAALWIGADVVITLKRREIPGLWDGFYPAPTEVTTCHAEELSWAFDDLRKLFAGEKLLNADGRAYLFGELAAEALRSLRDDPEIAAAKLCRAVIERAEAVYREMHGQPSI